MTKRQTLHHNTYIIKDIINVNIGHFDLNYCQYAIQNETMYAFDVQIAEEMSRAINKTKILEEKLWLSPDPLVNLSWDVL